MKVAISVPDHVFKAGEHLVQQSLLDLIESGEVPRKDEIRLWIVKSYADRQDNLLCAAVVLETVLVVKTVMHHFEIK